MELVRAMGGPARDQGTGDRIEPPRLRAKGKRRWPRRPGNTPRDGRVANGRPPGPVLRPDGEHLLIWKPARGRTIAAIEESCQWPGGRCCDDGVNARTTGDGLATDGGNLPYTSTRRGGRPIANGAPIACQAREFQRPARPGALPPAGRGNESNAPLPGPVPAGARAAASPPRRCLVRTRRGHRRRRARRAATRSLTVPGQGARVSPPLAPGPENPRHGAAAATFLAAFFCPRS